MKRTLKLITSLFLFTSIMVQANNHKENCSEEPIKCPTSVYAKVESNRQKPKYVIDSIDQYVIKDTIEKFDSRRISYLNEYGQETKANVYAQINGKWIISAQDSNEYDSKGNLYRHIHFLYASALGDIYPMYRNTYVYNDSNNVIEQQYDIYNTTTEEWKIVMRTDYTYDSLGRSLTETTNDWFEDLGKYIPFFRLVNRNFNAFNKPQYAEGFKFNSVDQGFPEDKWEDYAWDTLNYDAKGNLVETKRWMFYEEKRQPIESNRWVYDSQNQNIEHKYFRGYMDSTFWTWAPWSKTLTYYLEDGCIDNEVDYSATSVTTWEKVSRYQYFWSEFGKEPEQFDVGVTAISSPNNASQWTNSESVNIEVKNFGTSAVGNIPVICMVNNIQLLGNITKELAPGEKVQYTFENKVDMSKLSRYNLTAYSKLTTDTYRKNDTCKKMIKKVAIENSAKTKVTIYPNPANEQIHIESSIPIEKLTICNLSGQMLVDRVPDNANTCTIFISAFAKGTYIVNLYTHLGVEKRKITVFK